MTSTPTLHDALARFVQVARGMTDLGPMEHFTCSEAEAFVGVIRACGEHELADLLLAEHTDDDRDNGDTHDTEYTEAAQPVPLPFLIDERITGLTYAQTIIEGHHYPAREIYSSEGIVFEYQNDEGFWIEFDRHHTA